MKAAAVADLWIAAFVITMGLMSRAWSVAEVRRYNPDGAAMVETIGFALLATGALASIAALFVLTGRLRGWVVLFPFNLAVAGYGAGLFRVSTGFGVSVMVVGLCLAAATLAPTAHAWPRSH